MVVLKNLALGFLMTGMVAAPSLGGSIKHGHHPAHEPSGELRTPTTLNFVTTGRPVIGAAENLANSGNASFGLGTSGYGPAFGYGATSATSTSYGSTSSVWGTTSNTVGGAGSTAAQPNYYAAPAQPSYAAQAQPTYAAPASGSSLGSLGLNLGGSSTIGQVSSGHTVDALLNFGPSGFSEASALTSGNAQAWYLSPAVQHAFNGTPNASQQAGFINEVVQTVEHAYSASGLNISLTTDPTQNYAHTMSVVSGASYTANPNAIGITDVGNDGFSFIDKFGQAQNADQLATAVGNNLAHELMHAFGIAIHPDMTGTHLDAAEVTWDVLTNPNATLSPAAVQLLSNQNFLDGPGKDFTSGVGSQSGLEVLASHPTFTGEEAVPEPATIALWGLAGGIALACHRRRRVG